MRAVKPRVQEAWGAGLLITWVSVVSCGGRYLDNGDPSYDVAGSPSASGTSQGGKGTGSGGKPSSGGKAGSGGGGKAGSSNGSGGKAGSSSGGRGSASGSGGRPAGCPAVCDDLACPAGYILTPDADGCCYHCELDLATCDVARRKYAEFREQSAAMYRRSIACQLDSDCTLYFDMSACGSSCGTPIPQVALRELDERLVAYTKANCPAFCPPVPVLPCDVASAPRCLGGLCQ